jgi:hypothetical protein
MIHFLTAIVLTPGGILLRILGTEWKHKEPIENIPFLKATLVSGLNTYGHGPVETHLLFVLIGSNSIFTLKFINSESHSDTVWCHVLLRHYHLLPDTSRSKSFVILPDFNALRIFYWYFRKTLTVAFPNFRTPLKRPTNLHNACENSGLLRGRWHDVTTPTVSFKRYTRGPLADTNVLNSL